MCWWMWIFVREECNGRVEKKTRKREKKKVHNQTIPYLKRFFVVDGGERCTVHLEYRVTRPQSSTFRDRSFLDSGNVNTDSCGRKQSSWERGYSRISCVPAGYLGIKKVNGGRWRKKKERVEGREAIKNISSIPGTVVRAPSYVFTFYSRIERAGCKRLCRFWVYLEGKTNFTTAQFWPPLPVSEDGRV